MAMRKRCRVVSLLVALGVLLIGSFEGTTPKAAARTLIWLFPINTATGGFYPFYAARDLGFWQEEGLDVEFQGSGGSGAAIQLLIAGHVDSRYSFHASDAECPFQRPEPQSLLSVQHRHDIRNSAKVTL
jgi:ABC-type nitrate/sulfonate/bicarbonate transport system substrate-binding protein